MTLSDLRRKSKYFFTRLEGKGTKENPYKISNINELQLIEKDLTGHYELTQDIDATPTEYWNNKKGFKPIGSKFNKFTGGFDGNNHTITGLYIRQNSVLDDTGLFSCIHQATIKNIKLQDICIIGDRTVGGITGYSNVSDIRNVYIDGKIIGTKHIGGIVGENDGTIEECVMKGTVKGRMYIGGITGKTDFGTISDSVVVGTINGESATGGIVGELNKNITNSTFIGEIKEKSCGTIVGINNGKMNNLLSISTSGKAKENNTYYRGNGIITDTESFNCGKIKDVSSCRQYTPDVRIAVGQLNIAYYLEEDVLVCSNEKDEYMLKNVTPVMEQELLETHRENIGMISDEFRTVFVSESI